MLELKIRVDFVRWLDEPLYRRRRDGKQHPLLEGAYIQGKLHILKNKLPSQSGPCFQLKKGGGGLLSGGYGIIIVK